MKEILTQLPERSNKPREHGLTMMMDKGLSIREAEDFLSSNSEYTDIIKLGFGTSIITPNISNKIKLYHENGMKVYTGGTLFEAFLIRDQLDDYKRYLNKIGLEMVEISDGSMHLNHDDKCNIISEFSKDFRVISEVGSKDSNVSINSDKWLKWMQNELSAGSWKVIAEAREGGNVGICKLDGGIKSELIDEITSHINIDDILWESPMKNQQIWFINKFGANVNLGNILYDEIIPLESLRLGLRGDTFNLFLN
ncbi:MAG: phosphosulfolactate synthase [Flavobacteriales bacterium]|nr:phosphosulfolactate synthase [Flavobacteriales bacterium]|tara:strand:+ start:3433 stop:4191 length:759 start_codon:yes stop_codon:yes gene_type:complete